MDAAKALLAESPRQTLSEAMDRCERDIAKGADHWRSSKADPYELFDAMKILLDLLR